MGAFFEPEEGQETKIFTSEYITSTVKKAMASGEIPVDHTVAFIGIVNERGMKAILSAKIVDKKILNEKLDLNVKIEGVLEHEWTGKNGAGAQVLFTVK